MRSLVAVIDAIVAALPLPFPSEWQTNLQAFTVEIGIIRRRAVYQPPEASEVLWDSLGILINRYIPPPATAPWCAAIATIIAGNVV